MQIEKALNSAENADRISSSFRRDESTINREWDVRSRSLSSSTLELIILPTEQCNFRCTYCYEDFEIGKMPQDVIDGIKSLINRRSSTLKHLHLNYFGGEPLLNMKAIREISGLAKSLHDADILHLTSGMTTNGYQLNEPTLKELVDLHCTDFQVSLDGWGASHDKTRMRRNGGATFERIWENILAAKASPHKFSMLLRVHLMPDNEEAVLELARRINKDCDDPRFEVMLKQVGNWGGKNPSHPDVYNTTSGSFEEFYQRVKNALSRVSDVGVGESGGSLAEANTSQGSAPAICYAAKGNSLVVRANGRLNKCTVALRSKRNDIGAIRPDGTIEVDSMKLSAWMKGLATMDTEQLRCPAEHVLAQRA